MQRLTSVAFALSILAGVAACTGDVGDPETQQGASGEPSGGSGGNPFGPDGFEPAPGGMRRLLSTEYIRSIGLVLGAEAAAQAAPPEDIAQSGFDAIGAATLPMSIDPVEFYERSAEAVAEAVLSAPQRIADHAPCVTAGSAVDTCYEEVARNVGRLLWRRALADEEVASLVDVAKFAAAWEGEDDFHDAIKYELSALLQSPAFLYITEVGVPDEKTKFRKLDPIELASRMSFFLLGRTPDGALLDQAESGGLETEEEIRATAEYMLAGDEAKVSLDAFYDELFRLRNLADTAKNAELFPAWTPTLAEAMRTETLMLIDDVVWKGDADFRTMFSADYTYVNAELATLYNVPPPSGTGFEKVTLPEVQHRAGYTSQGAFLTHQSGPRRNSPTKRGKFVLSVLLCRTVKPPPPDVVPQLPENPPGNPSLQELLEQHMKDPSCSNCHGQTDPIGFAFEFYDAIGRFRTTDNGKPVSGKGEVATIGEWSNATELGNVLAESDELAPCMVRNLVRGKLGWIEGSKQNPDVKVLSESMAEQGHSLKTLLVEMTSSRLFQYVNEPR
jgi:hypothetical protein